MTVAPPAADIELADPFVLATPEGYVAYGTVPPASGALAFGTMRSKDLRRWRPGGGALERLPSELGDEYWAPEVARREGRYWMYYSVGRGIEGHHLRVATSESPGGPFHDCGLDLTPDERFAIDPSPFRAPDGRWYLYFARDVLDADRPGTHLAVAPLLTTTALGATTPVLAPYSDVHLYASDREMYGRRFEWHTLEGPSVLHRDGRYWLTFSGGAWTGTGYGVFWAVADSPLGPWTPASPDAPPLLATTPERFLGPGHSSFTRDADGSDVLVFHGWDDALARRRPYLARLSFGAEGPALGELLSAGDDDNRGR